MMNGGIKMNFDTCSKFLGLLRDPSVKRMFEMTVEDLLPNDLKWDALVDILIDNYSDWTNEYTDMMNDHQRDY